MPRPARGDSSIEVAMSDVLSLSFIGNECGMPLGGRLRNAAREAQM